MVPYRTPLNRFVKTNKGRLRFCKVVAGVAPLGAYSQCRIASAPMVVLPNLKLAAVGWIAANKEDVLASEIQREAYPVSVARQLASAY